MVAPVRVSENAGEQEHRSARTVTVALSPEVPVDVLLGIRDSGLLSWARVQRMHYHYQSPEERPAE